MLYALKSILRTPVKSLLLAALIMVSTVLLSIGVGMLAASEGMLKDADRVFLTAGEFVYENIDFWDGIEYNEELENIASSFSPERYEREEALLLEENITQRAYLEGYRSSSTNSPYATYSVLTVSVLYYHEPFQAWRALVLDTNYTEKDSVEQMIFIIADEEHPLQEGKYVIFGSLRRIPGKIYPAFTILSAADIIPPEETMDIADCSIAEFTGEESFWQGQVGSYYNKVADTLRIANQSVDVTASGRIEAVSEFHRGTSVLTEGSFFDEEDYKSGKACIISRQMAESLEKTVGDSISLSFHYPTKGRKKYDSYRSGDGFAHQEQLAIKGIYSSEYNNNPVYIPYAGQPWLGHSSNDPVLARVVLDNRKAEKYVEQVTQLLPDGVRLYVYDQGYQASSAPIKNMERTAYIITLTCLIASIIVLCLFSYLHIHTNRRSVRILLTLGTGSRRVVRHFVVGGGIIAFAAVTLGSFFGYLISKRVVSTVYSNMRGNLSRDYRFSINGYGIRSTEFTTAPQISPHVFGLLGITILILALVLCGIFTLSAIRRQRPERRQRSGKAGKERMEKRVPKDGTSSGGGTKQLDVLPFISLRYAMKNITRSGRQSILVPMLFAAMLLFLCIFAQVRRNFQERLGSVYEEIPVTLQFTDAVGRKTDYLAINPGSLEELGKTEFTGNGWASVRYYARYTGTYETADGSVPEKGFSPFSLPENEYALEALQYLWRSNSIPYVVTEDVRHSPQFYNTDGVEINWLEGMDWDTYSNGIDAENGLWGCILPVSFMKENHLAMGDVISFAVPYTTDFFYVQNVLTIIGNYMDDGISNAVFVSEKACMNALVAIRYDGNRNIVGDRWNAAGFQLQHTERLSDFKGWLETRYDQTGVSGKHRKWVVIDDRALYDTLENLNRYIQYMDLIYPILFVLIAGIGFLVSNLLLKNRAGEMIALRTMGQGRIGIFLSFFWDSFLLSVLGGCIGLLLSVLFFQDWSRRELVQNALLLAGCYYTGTSIAIIRTFHKEILRMLAWREE
ncbi:ABC-type lipoprotein release transport system permease subunit [Anaerotaenia torta]|uniref:ABC transporter permease n=1 Tax=Anaerotaenia torta TaxID=433293 RepID=UPI003D21EB28